MDATERTATAGGAAPRGPSIDGRPLEDRTPSRIGQEPVMWCACGCGKRVWPSHFSKSEGANGTNVYYVDEQHYELRRLRTALL